MQSLIPQDRHKIRITLNPLAYKNYMAAEISTIVVGREMKVGCTLHGLKIQRVALNPPTYDRWGDVTLIGDDYVKNFSAQMIFDTDNLDAMDFAIYKLFNTPAVYVLDDVGKYHSLTTFGIMTSNEISVDDAYKSGVPLSIKSFKYKKNIKEC